MLLIPAIDLHAGQCVRLYQGNYDAETRYAVTPQQLLTDYRQLGASWVHLVDLDGARDGLRANREASSRLAALAAQQDIKLQTGGGVREEATVETLLAAGFARVVVGSMAVSRPAEVTRWLRHFGPQTIVLAFDVRLDEAGTPRCAVHGWREQSALILWEAMETYADAGLRHVLCTDVARDGALSGPNLQLYEQAVQRFPEIEWQASGGVRDAADLKALAATGVAAAISGRALLENRFTPPELQPFLLNA